jgi:hypothetical protein
VSGVLVSGGPLEGVLDKGVLSFGDAVERIVLTHGHCGCRWCDGGTRVEHLYERRGDGVFVYRGRVGT